MLDWLRIWPELVRLNLQKALYRRRVARPAARVAVSPADTAPDSPPSPAPAQRPAPCQCPSDSGRAKVTRCEACLRFERSPRYAYVCPDLVQSPDGPFCGLDSADIRPRWSHAFSRLLGPPLALAVIAILGSWLTLRQNPSLSNLSLVDVAWPPRWAKIAEHRRDYFREIAVRAIAAGDAKAASVALIAAVRSGVGDPDDNRSLALLATRAGYYDLSDTVHTTNIARHPLRAAEFAMAWHDDLLVANRPREIAHLALDQLNLIGTPREFWLRAFFESIRHPGVARSLLAAQPPLILAHPGLRPAMTAAAALEAGNRPAASEALLALRGALPGDAARRFLVFGWLEVGDLVRARFACIDPGHPAPPGETAFLTNLIFYAAGDSSSARGFLRPLLDDTALRSKLLAELVALPDEDMIASLATRLTEEECKNPIVLHSLWLAARRAGLLDLAQAQSTALAVLGQALPAELQLVDFTRPAAADLNLVAALLPLDREMLYVLRTPPPLAPPAPPASN